MAEVNITAVWQEGAFIHAKGWETVRNPDGTSQDVPYMVSAPCRRDASVSDRRAAVAGALRTAQAAWRAAHDKGQVGLDLEADVGIVAGKLEV